MSPCTLNSEDSTPEISFSTWDTFCNQNADDLSENVYFYTGKLLHKQKSVYYNNNYFLEEPTHTKFFCNGMNMFRLRCISIGFENY